jgi:hypothetical protein
MHNLFLVYFVNLYMFRECLHPSSGGTTVCIQQLVLILFRWLTVGLVGQSTKNNKKHQLMGLDTPETCRGWRNILRIRCASSWFSFTREILESGPVFISRTSDGASWIGKSLALRHHGIIWWHKRNWIQNSLIFLYADEGSRNVHRKTADS